MSQNQDHEQDADATSHVMIDWSSERVSLGRHFLRDMEGLWSGALRLAAVVESSLHGAIHALIDGRPDLAAEVERSERTVDSWEVEIERDCLKILTLHQPAASDLRRVAAILRINGDLERTSDMARNIARRVRKLATDPAAFPLPRQMEALALRALQQLHDSLDALVQGDAARAREVIKADREIDRQYRLVLQELKGCIRSDPDRINTWLRLINTARNLERVADHATHITEAVVYLKEGEIIRHHAAEPRPERG